MTTMQPLHVSSAADGDGGMTQPGEVRIQRAVLSVSDKTGLVEFARGLAEIGVELALREKPHHMAAAKEHDVQFVDLVCVNLYPFEATAARRGVTEHEVIENIDIGGPTMIRAAAKNFSFTAVVVNPASYDAVMQELSDAGGKLSLGTRESLASEAFSYTARYDSAISRWFVEKQDDFPNQLLTAFE